MMRLLQASPVLFGVAALVVLCVIGMLSYRATLGFRLSHWHYTFPLIGKTARLARSGRRAPDGWSDSERTLCGDYNKFIADLSRAEFANRNDYLAKADDSGRAPMPLWLLALLAVLVIAEGLGFSYLLGSWMAREGSANTHTLLMLAIVLVLCVIMVFLTHVSGHQLYRSNLVVRCRTQWQQHGGAGGFSTRRVKLDEDQRADSAEPDYTQTVNRVGTDHSYFMVVLAVLVVLMIAGTTTWMRWSNLNAEQTRATMSVDAELGNPFAPPLLPREGAAAQPDELLASQQAADDRAAAEALAATRSEGAAAFITLAVIFIVTQIVGMYGGYAWGFGGRESHAAWKTTKGFQTFDDYNRHFLPYRSIAQSQLEHLQKRMAANTDIAGHTTFRTFRDYVIEQQRLEYRDNA